MRLLARLAALFAPRWPVGEPLIVAGTRMGTRVADGSIITAPNVRIELVRCANCLCERHLNEPDCQQNNTTGVEQEPCDGR